jgi:hypothetical protein
MGVFRREVFRPLFMLLSVSDALTFGWILLLPPLVQLSLDGLHGVPNVLLGRQRSLRGGCWCWGGLRRSCALLWQRVGDLPL